VETAQAALAQLAGSPGQALTLGALALNLWSNLLGMNVVQQYLVHSGLGSTRI
jgi:hypothetical protein